MQIVQYTIEEKEAWNKFITTSKNGTFLFLRDYMEYHANRFTDCSWMVYSDKCSLMAVLPANRKGDTLYSHQGLTFGGWIINTKATTKDVLTYTNLLIDKLQEIGCKHLIYKPIPYIYSCYPSQEDLYMLFCKNANRIACAVGTVIDLNATLPMTTLRKRGVKKAEKEGLIVSESQDISSYWNILEHLLCKKFNASPVHTLSEIEYLKKLFPNNIKFFAVFTSKGDMLAGTLLYISDRVIRTQYIASTEEGKKYGALDFLFHELILHYSKDYHYFEFGTSVEQGGHILNEGLISQKEGFGGRAIVFDTYEINI